nr:serpin family protein [Lachnospiraceae bacterium]
MNESRGEKSKRTLIICTSIVVIGVICTVCTALTLSKGRSSARAKDLMEGVSKEKVTSDISINEYSKEIMDFGVNLLLECDKSAGEDENTLVSPLSAVFALSMTANGAENETLAQMEDVLGLKTDKLNNFSSAYLNNLSKRVSVNGTLNIANSIWFKEAPDLTVNTDFLQINANHYGAELFSSPFDNKTSSEINSWVNTKTDGNIPKIIDKIDKDTVMYLINALSFDAKWYEPYKDKDVKSDNFTTSSGKKVKKSFLCGNESEYIRDTNAQGFIKDYAYGAYSFIAILPNEGITPDEYLAGLSAGHLSDIILNHDSWQISTKMPKFKTDYSVEMSDVLKGMGMPLAFDCKNADFSKMGSGGKGDSLYIGEVIHKTYISVDEKGTKAGAATSVGMRQKSEPLEEVNHKEVFLTRPFVYM